MTTAHIDVFMNNIVKNLAYDGSTASLVMYILWFSVCGLMMAGCVWGMGHVMRHPPPSMFGPTPFPPLLKDKHGN